MPTRSAGILLYRRVRGDVEVFLVHHGGPYWAGKDLGAWSIPKGEVGPGEQALEVARREFAEETGCILSGHPTPLEPVSQAGGKVVHAWAMEGDCDPAALRSNTFALEWPPRSGQTREFPEVDRAVWVGLAEARRKLLPSQLPLIDQLTLLLSRTRRDS